MIHVFAVSLIKGLVTETEISSIYGDHYLKDVLEIKDEYLEKI